MFKKLRHQLMAINIAMMIVILLVSYSVTYILMNQFVDNNIGRELSRIEMSTKNQDKPPLDENGSGEKGGNKDDQTPENADFSFEGLPDKLSFKQEFSVFVDEDTGEVLDEPPLFSYNSSVDYEAMVKSVLDTGKNRGTYNLDGMYWAYTVKSKGDGTIQVTMIEADSSLNLLTSLPWIFLAVTIIMLIIIWFVSRFLVNRAIQPIRVSFEKQEQFISDASHELKTPVAIIRTNLDVIEMSDADATVASQEKWLSIIRLETDRMQTLTNRLLYLARMEDESTKIEHLPVDFSMICEESMLSMEAVYFERNQSVEEKIEENLWVKGDQDELRQVVYILLENAGKYAPKGGNIKVQLKKVSNKVVFSVQNSGEGLSETEKERVFDRLYRGDQARDRTSGSYGLGLAIAQQIMERHHGTITVESEKNRYTKFTVSFPSYNKENRDK